MPSAIHFPSKADPSPIIVTDAITSLCTLASWSSWNDGMLGSSEDGPASLPLLFPR